MLNYITMYKIVLYILLNFAFSSSGSILFGDIDNINQTIDILYDSSHDILGIQFEVSGIEVNSFSGGAIEEYSFEIFNQGSTILSFGASDHIPLGFGLLTKIHYDSFSDNNCIVYAKMVTNNGQLICGECSDANNQESFCEDMEFTPNFCTVSECLNNYYRLILSGSNLISFWELPENNSISNIFSTCGSSIIGEATAASYQGEELGWVGALNEVECNSGYWVISEQECEISFTGIPCQNEYQLNEGFNLISYPFNIQTPITLTIPDNVEQSFVGLIGEAVAATQILPFDWVGNLYNLKGGNGYWAKINEPIIFSFQYPDSIIIELNNN